MTEYLKQAELLDVMESLGFHVVGYGCATCIGNSGPLPEPVSKAIAEGDLSVCSVLSGNRNFEGRVHAEVRMNYLASPPLVVAYALAGTMNIDLYNDAIAQDADGNDVFLKDIWPSQAEIKDVINSSVNREEFTQAYDDVYRGEDRWLELIDLYGGNPSWINIIATTIIQLFNGSVGQFLAFPNPFLGDLASILREHDQ